MANDEKSRGFPIRVKRRRDGELHALIVKGPCYFQDANGVYWKRSVATDGTFTTPENSGTIQPRDGVVFEQP